MTQPDPSDSPALTDISAARPPFFWGVDIGGTGIKLGLVDDAGQTFAYENLPTRESEGPTSAVQRIAAVIDDAGESLGISGDVRRIGLGAPGPMDLAAGTLVQPPQLPTWWGFPIRDALADVLRRPVSFLNDANAAAFGEFWLGSGRTDASMVLLTLGTGVGGGVIVDGEMVNGINSFGSECGHIIIDPSPTARLCTWGGGRGQLEAYASASGVVQRTMELLGEGHASSLSMSSGKMSAKRVYLAAKDGDALALRVIDETAFYLGVGITTIVHILDPGAIVLGGAMDFGGVNDPVGRRFLERVRAEFVSRTFDNVAAGTTIKFASLGAHAGYLGLCGYARKQSQSA